MARDWCEGTECLLDNQTLFDPDEFGDGWRYCQNCISKGYWVRYPPEYFRKQKGRNAAVRSHYCSKVCNGCRQELDDSRLLRQSLARRIGHHAKRWKIPIEDMRQRYGMRTDAVVEWFLRIWDGGILACGCPTGVMNHGWRDAEIDRIDPNAEPYFPHNWQVMCSVHNNSKARSTPTEFAARLRGDQLWHEVRGIAAK